MHVLKLTGKKVLSTTEMDVPKPDGKNVIIKVSRVGICGTDLHYWEDESCVGLVMGHEYTGVVTDPGARADLKAGDRVTAVPINPCLECPACKSGNLHLCLQTLTQSPGNAAAFPGAYAEYTAARPDMVRKLPDTVSDAAGAMIEPSSVAIHAVREARITVGDKVLITGAGIIGLLAAMFARKAGASLVVMTEANPVRAEGARKFGDAHYVFDALNPTTMLELMKVSDPGFDVCIECAGVGSAIDTAVAVLNPGTGVLVQVALNLKPVPISLAFLVVKEVKIRPVLGCFVKEFDMCLNMIAKKEIDVERFISGTCGFDGAQDAFTTLTSGKSQDVKIAILP